MFCVRDTKIINKDLILESMSEEDIFTHYFNIKKLPILIQSPIRKDQKPSFSIYRKNSRICWKDFATGEHGDIFSLLQEIWKCSFPEVIKRIYEDTGLSSRITPVSWKRSSIPNETTKVECKIRDWESYDLEYWGKFGIDKKWLEYAEVFPIAYKIIIKGDKRYTFKADKYAYAFVERKEGKVTLKLYQPFNTKGFKWLNKNDGSVIGLWTKLPKEGPRVCICSSLKDALCLWANTGIPAIYVQGEGYGISNTAKNVLKKRFKNIYVCFDNDKAGLQFGKDFAEKNEFINIVLPNIPDAKDISDIFKKVGKEEFLALLIPLFQEKKKENNEKVDFNSSSTFSICSSPC